MRVLAITRNELLAAMRAVASAEFAHIPKTDDEIDLSFSPSFLKRMERLFRNQKKAYWKYVNTVGKRVALIAASVLILFATACSIKPIREPMFRFFTEIYETFTAYFFEGDAEEKVIEHEYCLDPVPEGFAEVSRVSMKTIITTNYENADGISIKITQATSDGTNLNLDTERDNAVTETINGIEVIFHRFESQTQAMFMKDGYFFQILCIGSDDLALVYEVVENLR